MSFKRLHEQAYDHLRDMILAGKFEPDVFYSETKIAETLGVSRTPTRDALQKLSHDGFIDIMPSKGFRLHKLTVRDIMEIYQMRCAVEGYCARLLAEERSTPRAQAAIAIMRDLLDQQEIIIDKTQSVKDFVEVDFQFHSYIIGYAENDIFNEVYRNQIFRIRIVANEMLGKDNRMRKSLDEHQALLDTIAANKPDKVYKEILIHYDNLSKTIPQTFSGSNSMAEVRS